MSFVKKKKKKYDKINPTYTTLNRLLALLSSNFFNLPRLSDVSSSTDKATKKVG